MARRAIPDSVEETAELSPGSPGWESETGMAVRAAQGDKSAGLPAYQKSTTWEPL